MPTLARQVFVISDLHLGGRYPDGDAPGDRGFRICTHAEDAAAFIRSLTQRPADDPAVELVVNGDLVDFLAERHGDGAPWRPFNADPDVAVALLRSIVARDQGVFDALAAFLAAGHRLVILLGNHDVELALPQVRAVLIDALGAEGRDFTFIHDGEAYVVGDALIEHGNDYDDWNRVNFAQLRRIRAALSRRSMEGLDFFEPPAGSHMVADIINPIKEHYKFVDLLKPETSASFPLLLALEPGYKPLLLKAARNRARAADIATRRSAAHAMGADISAQASAAPGGLGVGMGGPTSSMGSDLGSGMGGGAPTAAAPVQDDALTRELRDALGDDGEAEFTAALAASTDETTALGHDISSADTLASLAGSFRLFFSRGASDDAVRRRMPALLQALRATQDDASFDRTRESAAEYWKAAQKLAQGPVKHVVFGHTHLPKKVALPSGGWYLNAGTWADVLRFPDDLIQGDKTTALAKLDDFVEAMKVSDFSAYTLFRPTYVRLDIDASGVVVEADLCDYEGATP
jgi:UDP-2,3-diacylglucosamine pyrophosphatase LpxH